MDTCLRERLQQQIEVCRRLTDELLLDPSWRNRVGPDHLARAVLAYIERPAKRLRPALLLTACQAAGGSLAPAVPAAAAIEVFHTWTLVHDDVIDNDSLRRGSPTVHVAAREWGKTELGLRGAAATEYGRHVAILAGDVQQAWANALLLGGAERGVPERIVLGLALRMQTVLNVRLIEGEMLDVQLSCRSPDTVDEAEVLRMIRLKTGVLLGFAAAAGAAIGCGRLPGESTVVDALDEFAVLCGSAFQLQDDILGIVGDQEQLGKPVGSDIREGKATTIVLHALHHASPPARRLLERVLGNREATPGDLAQVPACLEACGALAHTRDLARGFLDRALELLRLEVPPSPSRDLLEAWAERTLDRSS